MASASPLNRDPEHLRRLERAGIGAIVLPSLFEEQVLAEQRWAERVAAVGSEASPEVRSYFPEDMVPGGAAAYLDLVRHAVETVRIPIIASLNGTATTGWTASARAIQEAGAQGLELNIYQLPTDLSLTGRAVEERHLEVLAAVRQAVSIPIAVKLMPGSLHLPTWRRGSIAGVRAHWCCSTATTCRISTSWACVPDPRWS